MNATGRALLLFGGAAVALSAVLPWVTVKGLTVALDLGLVGATLSPAARTVAGTDTSLWPALLFVAACAVAGAIFGPSGFARRLLAGLGALTVAGGGALLYYVSNVIEIKTKSGGELERRLADLVLTSAVGPGTPLLIAGGLAIVAGALVARP